MAARSCEQSKNSAFFSLSTSRTLSENCCSRSVCRNPHTSTEGGNAHAQTFTMVDFSHKHHKGLGNRTYAMSHDDCHVRPFGPPFLKFSSARLPPFSVGTPMKHIGNQNSPISRKNQQCGIHSKKTFSEPTESTRLKDSSSWVRSYSNESSSQRRLNYCHCVFDESETTHIFALLSPKSLPWTEDTSSSLFSSSRMRSVANRIFSRNSSTTPCFS